MDRIGVLTGGGDCPGLNAAIRAVVRRAPARGVAVVGFRHGWQGLIAREHLDLGLDEVAGTLPRGGTVLGTSRTDPCASDETRDRALETARALALRAVVVLGGDGTLRAAARMHAAGLPVIGVPKTIDNDVAGTDLTIGFDTAVAIACEAIDRLHTTAESHDRVMVVEVMGRRGGWIAAASAVASGADFLVVPEQPTSVADVCAVVEARRARGRSFSIVVVAEGAEIRGDDGASLAHGGAGVGHALARAIERRTGHETRVTVLGHVQRGGTPTAFDRILATRFGVLACDLAAAGRTGVMTAVRGGAFEAVALHEATTALKPLDPALYDLARVFFG